MDNVIDFVAYRKERERVRKHANKEHELIQEEIMREDFLEFILNTNSYDPDTFTFTIDLDGDDIYD